MEQRRDSVKSHGHLHQQQHRRTQFLEQQRTERRKVTDLIRGLTSAPVTDAISSDSDDDAPPPATTTLSIPASKDDNPYKNQLMMSEWLQDLPEDPQNWILVPCPEGQRRLIIASGGKTRAWSRHGKLTDIFMSNLPGGSAVSTRGLHEHAILDCIYQRQARRYYVLDMMAWKGTPFYECDTEFRYFFMTSKFQEVECARVTPSNQRVFEPLRPAGDLHAALNWRDFKVDGIRFIHKQTFYTPGICTPLCLWSTPDKLAMLI